MAREVLEIERDRLLAELQVSEKKEYSAHEEVLKLRGAIEEIDRLLNLEI